jgi:hypothetical protein
MSNKVMILGNCEVKFSHEYKPEHLYNEKTEMTKVIQSPKATNVNLKTPFEVINARVSCSYKDHFRYETGRKQALRKAFKGLKTPLTKEEKRRVWDEYNKLKPNGRW